MSDKTDLIDRLMGQANCESPPVDDLLLEAVDRIAAIEAENARLREDAGRYAWIRDNCYPHEYLHRGHSHVVVSVYLGDDDRGRAKIMHPGKETKVGIPSLDSAIDAARGEEQK